MTAPPTPRTPTEALAVALRDIERISTQALRHTAALHETVLELKDLALRQSTLELQRLHPNPLNRAGRQCFSQSDEDGITLEILRRLGAGAGVFAEFGVGNGLENNTLILGALGWKGFWVGGEPLAFDCTGLARLAHLQEWITLDNLGQLTTRGLSLIGAETVDLISLDLDGNDFHFAEALLQSRLRPALFIVEYNAKLPPPARFRMPYDSTHRWAGDDYFGAALTDFVELFASFGFTLVCCNAHTGCNAFFVRDESLHAFQDVPRDVATLYAAPRYHVYRRHGHPTSTRLVQTLFAR